MREIKFRAWNGKRMVDDDYFHVRHGMAFKYTEFDGALPTDWELMQYTGLKDKNGKEIYEGDIVNFTYWWFDGNEAESNLCGEVVYLDSCMSFGLKHVKNSDWCKHTGADRNVGDTDAFATWLFDEADFEVIGNIYENKELLNE